jgi:ATP-independent RNA helicase DbpA
MTNEMISPGVENSLRNLGFESLNPMQSEMIKVCQTARQVLLFSPTGSGKTAAFLFPVLEKVILRKSGISALILVPSRELALQIEQVFKSMGTGYKVTTCYGGHKVKTELNNLTETPSLLIGTPGRINYHLEKGNIRFDDLDILVMDEYDKSLEFGFEREISSIISHIPAPGQVILTSATQSVNLPDFLQFRQPVVLDYSSASKPSGLEIKIVRSEEKDKLSLLLRLLKNTDDGLSLVFCNHRDAVERISYLLSENSIHHDTYHGGYEQAQRERALIKFRNGSTQVLVTTDLASRGLDIEGVTNIIHYQPAGSETVFVHRNGRTARMNNNGTVWVLLSASDKIPGYVPEYSMEVQVPEKSVPYKTPRFSTLYFGAGKKDKIGKTDIVGLLIQKGGLQKDEIGLINILDHDSFAAIPTSKIRKVVQLLENEKIKKKRTKIEHSN